MLAMGLRKNNPEFLDWLNKWVTANLENGKLGAIFKQYHHVELSPQVLDTGK
jgi:polar amino acid transport system substrate-binding protein